MNKYRNKLEQEKGKRETLINVLNNKKEQLKIIDKDKKYLEEAILITQEVAQKTQNELKYHISEMVSLALATVFDDPYEFKLVFETKRNKTEAKITFVRDEYEVDPIESSGGGAVQVAAFALRIALWNLQRPKSINTMVLDEPFRFVSLDLQAKTSEMLKMLSEKLNIQFIISTHIEELIEYADKVFYVTQEGGVSNVENR